MNMEKMNTENLNIFKIDLLKGEGVPPKMGTTGIVITAVTTFIPVVIAMILLGQYFHNEVMMKIKQQDIVKLEAKTEKLSDAVEIQKSLEKEKIFYNACLSDVKTSP